jgi:hypothetical protein
LGRKCLNGWKAKKNHHTQFFLDKPTVLWSKIKQTKRWLWAD